MAMQVVGLDKLKAKFLRLGEAAEEVLEQAVLAGALPIRNEAAERAPKRTRTLARSIQMQTTLKENRRVTVQVGTNLEYAAIYEYGGTIVPKNQRFLAVPLTEGARQYVGPRNYPGKLHAVMSGPSSGVLVDEEDVAQFALVLSVTIEARPYLRPAFDLKRGEAVQIVGDVLLNALKDAD